MLEAIVAEEGLAVYCFECLQVHRKQPTSAVNKSDKL